MRIKLEPKYISPYLPFGLRWAESTHHEIHTMIGIIGDEVWCSDVIDDTYSFPIDDSVSPMLRPIYHLYDAGEAERLKDDLGGEISDAILDWISYFYSDAANIDIAILCAPYPVINWALENHYDIFSLIPQGLAVPIYKSK